MSHKWESFGSLDIAKENLEKVQDVLFKVASDNGAASSFKSVVREDGIDFTLPPQPFDVPTQLMDCLKGLVRDGSITIISDTGLNLVYRYLPDQKSFVCLKQSVPNNDWYDYFWRNF